MILKSCIYFINNIHNYKYNNKIQSQFLNYTKIGLIFNLTAARPHFRENLKIYF